MPTLQAPHTLRGDKILIEGDTKKKRTEIAAAVLNLIRKGHAIFLVRDNGSTARIRGYDALDNTWILDKEKQPGKSRKTESIPAKGTKAMVVPAQAGG